MGGENTTKEVSNNVRAVLYVKNTVRPMELPNGHDLPYGACSDNNNKIDNEASSNGNNSN